MIGKTVVYLATIGLVPFVAYIFFFYTWVLEIDAGKQIDRVNKHIQVQLPIHTQMSSQINIDIFIIYFKNYLLLLTI